MKKLAFAFAASLMTVSAASVSVPAYASCLVGKIGWTYNVSGQTMTGYEMIAFVDNITGGDYDLQGAVQWLATHGYRVTVISRDCD